MRRSNPKSHRGAINPGADPIGDSTSHPMAPSIYHIRAMLDGLDQVATDMERKWGVGRLRLLVSDFLRAKFDAQKDKLDAAIDSDRETLVRIQVEGMKRAWATLDKTAREAGHQGLSPEVWECVLPSTGEVISIVHTEAEAQHICRACRVFTLAEIGQLIEGLGETVLAAKSIFPGATITAVREPMDWEHGDEMPF